MLEASCLVQHVEHPGHHAAGTSAELPQVAAQLQEHHIWPCLRILHQPDASLCRCLQVTAAGPETFIPEEESQHFETFLVTIW